jgi:hypothetical protein
MENADESNNNRSDINISKRIIATTTQTLK